ncbi:MAG: signal peptidase I [bacterium]|nr:signal peptidase I [bacterium]
MATIFRKLGVFFLDTLQTIVLAAAIFVISYLFLFQPHQVIGSSMDPNFVDQEYILTDKISYRFRTPERGDVIVFKSPPDPEKDYIKRIIGLPGEKIKIQGGNIFINGQLLKEDYLVRDNFVGPGPFLREGADFQIPPDFYIVFGDNRNHSSDSREWGPTTRTSIVGRAFLRYWPPQDIGLLPGVKYSL